MRARVTRWLYARHHRLTKASNDKHRLQVHHGSAAVTTRKAPTP